MDGELALELAELVRELRELAPDVWAIYYRQVWITGLIETIAGLVGVSLFGAGAVVLARKLGTKWGDKVKKEINEEPFFFFLGGLVAIIALGVPVVFVLGTLYTGIMKLVNPGYYVIKELLGGIG